MAQFEALTTISGDRGLADGEVKDLCLCLTRQFPYETLSDKERKALLFMREEEKLARDVYTFLHAKWNARVFSNIAKAEQRHMDAILCLIKKYGLTDPVGGNPAGVFQNNNLQALYTALTADGLQNLPAALTVGARIEDLDLFDLNQATPDIDNEDILAVFDELKKGSRNHIRAFVQNLEAQNSSYTPVYISADLFQNIIHTPRERGGSVCTATCPNANTPNCQGKGPNGAGNCGGNGPNGNGNGPNGAGNCGGNGPNGNGNGPNGNGNGNPNGNGN
ncbi:MAG: DUF2202 domain-containing protein [Saprospirales bacterium]|nr:DUF2202 domain-containing protein [Saprospirales bacterium]